MGGRGLGGGCRSMQHAPKAFLVARKFVQTKLPWAAFIALLLVMAIAAPMRTSAQETGSEKPAASSPAAQQAGRDIKTCEAVQGSPAVAACTRLLNQGK